MKKHSPPHPLKEGQQHIYDSYTQELGDGTTVLYIDSADPTSADPGKKGYGKIEENDVLWIQAKDETCRDGGIDGFLDPQGNEETNNSKYRSALRELRGRIQK